MQNVVVNKPITASSYIPPFSPDRAIHTANPIDRWLCNNLPCFLEVNLQDTYTITHWAVVGMGNLYGWNINAANYQLPFYTLQGSLDRSTWYTIDTGTYNDSSAHLKNISEPQDARFIRLYIQNGIIGNPQIASVVEFIVYGNPPTSSLLSNLSSSTGVLSPSFSPLHNSYTIDVDSSTEYIAFQPTAEDYNASITVNGSSVISGYYSNMNPLQESSITTIPIVVNPPKNTYLVAVRRASNAYLSDIKFVPPLTLTPAFTETTFNYNATTDKSGIRLIPTALDSNATIEVNGNVVASGSPYIVNLVDGTNTITIQVKPAYGTIGQTYILNITKTS